MKTLMGLNQDLAGRHVVIVEDIVDSGFTMAHMIEDLKKMNPASVEVCSLLVKPGNLKVDLDINYAVMEIPNDFIVAKRDFIREVCFLRGYLLYGQHEDPDGFEPGFGRPPRGYRRGYRRFRFHHGSHD